jgi:hypothetical protein
MAAKDVHIYTAKEVQFNKRGSKDKLYCISEKSGIPKMDLNWILDVSETTLRLWSYNPANVSEEMADRLLRKIALMDILKIRIELYDGIRQWNSYSGRYDTGGPFPREFLWRVHHHFHDECITRDYRAVIRNDIFYAENRYRECLENCSDEAVQAWIEKSRWTHRGYCYIAQDKSLEMPVGQTHWTGEVI